MIKMKKKKDEMVVLLYILIVKLRQIMPKKKEWLRQMWVIVVKTKTNVVESNQTHVFMNAYEKEKKSFQII